MRKYKKKNQAKTIIISLIIIAIISVITYKMYNMYQNIEIKSNYEATRTSLSTKSEETVEKVKEKSKTVVEMLEETTKNVVGISRLTNAGGSILSNISSDELGLGTGIIVSKNGYILSNSHVTGEKYGTCYVTIEENKYKGTVVWSDTNLDLSIVKINSNNLQYAPIGDSSNIKVGEQVYAIGNPIGYEFRRTVTSGIISALNRTIKIDDTNETSYVSDLIQTDATINPGNSGGPLINSEGKVIGVNTVKITSAEGIGFAIPINVIKPVIESFRENGKFEEATLGIYAYDADVAEYLKVKKIKNRGIYVSQIMINGPAHNSGLYEGDLITYIDEKKINTINDLREYIYSKKPRDTVVLKVMREEEEKEIEIILGKR